MTSIPTSDLLLILGAVALAGIGGESFLRSILGASTHLRIPRAVAATTLAAFSTSSPELTVSAVAALSGRPEIGLGDALGSNVVNIALIFGLALLFGAMRTSRKDFGRDFALALVAPIVTLAFALDGRIGRGEGATLLMLFAIWLVMTLRSALQQRHGTPEQSESAGPGPWQTLALGAIGLGAMLAAGRLFVLGATGVATALQIDTYVIGALVVAIGTSLPELVTVLLARLRCHDDVGVGTLIGSNIFNGLAIVGVAAGIHPITVPVAEIAVTLACGVAALLLLLPNSASLIPRGRSLLLLVLYGGFIWTTVAVGQ